MRARSGPGGGAGRIEREALGRFGLQRNGHLSTAAFDRTLTLDVIVRLVRGDTKQPRLKLAVSLERDEVLDHSKERFLANLLHVFAGEVGADLLNKAGRSGVVPVEQLVPGICVTFPAASEHLAFARGAHFQKRLG